MEREAGLNKDAGETIERLKQREIAKAGAGMMITLRMPVLHPDGGSATVDRVATLGDNWKTCDHAHVTNPHNAGYYRKTLAKNEAGSPARYYRGDATVAPAKAAGF
jgi:chromosome segregation protein